MKALILTVGSPEAGSSKFRIHQYLPHFESWGLEVQIVQQKEVGPKTLDLARTCQILINQKCLLPSGISKKLLAACPETYFDFDDAIYTRPGKRFSFFTQRRVNHRLHLWLRKSKGVMAANDYLGSYARRYSPNTHVVPMGLDLQVWKQKPKSRESSSLHIGWAGAPNNLKHLEAIQAPLKRFLQEFPHASLAVYSGARPQLDIPYSYFPFSDGSEADFVQGLDIGLLPLAEEEFSRGKSPIKSLQYLSCGIPVVGNIFGATCEILDTSNSLEVLGEEDWYRHLCHLAECSKRRESLGSKGLEKIRRLHDKEQISNQIKKIILPR